MICALLRDFREHGQKPIAKVRQTQPATYLKIALLVPKGDENEHTNSLSSGDDPKQSVVDKFERSHDHKNLYLVGRSTFPTGATADARGAELADGEAILDTASGDEYPQPLPCIAAMALSSPSRTGRLAPGVIVALQWGHCSTR